MEWILRDEIDLNTPNEMIFGWMNLITWNEVKVDGWINKGWITLIVETSQLRKLNSMQQIGTHVLIIHLMGEIDQLNHTSNNSDPWMNVSDPHRTNKFKWRMLQKWISCTFMDEIVTQLKGGHPEPGLPLE
jgi:hypothetical protein